MENKDRIKSKLSMEKEGDNYISVIEKKYDYSDKGYYTEMTQKMKVLDKGWLKENVESIKNRIIKLKSDTDQNDSYLYKIKEEYQKHWDSKDFNSFMKNYDKKYSKLIKWKQKHDEYVNKTAQNDQWKIELETEQMFDKHYQEMLDKWEK